MLRHRLYNCTSNPFRGFIKAERLEPSGHVHRQRAAVSVLPVSAFYIWCQSINKNIATVCPGVWIYTSTCQGVKRICHLNSLYPFRFEVIKHLALTETALHGNQVKKQIDISWRPSNVPSDKRKRTGLLYFRSQDVEATVCFDWQEGRHPY